MQFPKFLPMTVGVLLAAATAANATSYTYATVSVFSALSSTVNDVGQSVDAVETGLTGDDQGYLYDGSSTGPTILNVPGAASTDPSAISNNGQIVGTFQDFTGDNLQGSSTSTAPLRPLIIQVLSKQSFQASMMQGRLLVTRGIAQTSHMPSSILMALSHPLMFRVPAREARSPMVSTIWERLLATLR